MGLKISRVATFIHNFLTSTTPTAAQAVLEIGVGTGYVGQTTVASGTTLLDDTDLGKIFTMQGGVLNLDAVTKVGWIDVFCSVNGSIEWGGTVNDGTDGTVGISPYTLPTGRALRLRHTGSNVWVMTDHDNTHIDINGAVNIGDPEGDARGSNATNIQPARTLVTQVASGVSAIAVGHAAKASGARSLAIGLTAEATADEAVALGQNSDVSAIYSVALGYSANSSGIFSTSIGFATTTSGSYTVALGNRTKTTVDKTSEIGYWSGSSTRGASVRTHGLTGMVGLTIQDRATAYTDGGITAGSEADNTLMREGYSFRRDGTDLYVDLNIAGTITTKQIGAPTTTSVTGTTYTTLATDRYILANNAAGVAVTLLAAATAGDGFKIDIKRVGATGTITIDGNASETIDGALTATLTTQYESLTIVCDGSNWHII